MAHFPDLAPYWYFRAEPGTYHVGWLDPDHRFPTGDTSDEFRSRLESLCRNPPDRLATKGTYTCLLCGCVDGGSEIRVRLGERVFAAPVLVSHYVNDHGYRPPEDFIRAVLGTPRPPPSARPHGFPRRPAPSPEELADMLARNRRFNDMVAAERKRALEPDS